ncbi:paraquat-inducible protein A [Bdellovibrio bacteriovorus]
MFPFMTLELYGNRQSATVWGGVVQLMDKGHWPIGLVVFLASMVIPLIKLAILFYLSLTAKNGKHTKLKTQLYLIVEVIGRWSMLDIFLLAVLVAVVKLGSWTNIEPEPGALMFALVVIFTMMASAYFKPEILWDHHKENEGG